MEATVGGLTIAPLAILTAVISFLVHLFFAIGVSTHASKLGKHRAPWFVGRAVWFFATLFGGVTVAAVYWVMHCSTLSPVSMTNE